MSKSISCLLALCLVCISSTPWAHAAAPAIIAPTLSGVTSTVTTVNSTNQSAVPINCNGVTDIESGHTIVCEMQYYAGDAGYQWSQVGTATAPLYSATISGTANLQRDADGVQITKNFRVRDVTEYNQYYITNVSGQQTLTFATKDATPPATSATVNGVATTSVAYNNVFTAAPTVVIQPADAGSGIASTVYCVDQVGSCMPTTPYTASFVVSTTGMNYVHYRSTDVAGNVQGLQQIIIALNVAHPPASPASPVSVIPVPLTANIFDWSNVQNWPHSVAPKLNALWSTIQMPDRAYNASIEVGEMSDTQMIDINGDGLSDFVYINHTPASLSYSTPDGVSHNVASYTAMQDVVALNTGNGFNVVYACVTGSTGTGSAVQVAYYGDCADTNSATPSTYNPVVFGGNSSPLPTSSLPNFNVPYSTLSFFPHRIFDFSRNIGEMPTRTFTDLNGDGLPDFMYVNHGFSGSGNGSRDIVLSVVMLNTGSGWTPVYQCTASGAYSYTDYLGATKSFPASYSGDCAVH